MFRKSSAAGPESLSSPQTISQTCTTLALFIGGSVSVGALLGIAPRAGPLRALALAWRPRLRTSPKSSQRFEDKEALLNFLASIHSLNMCVCITGCKGTGKTVMIKDALQRLCGTVFVPYSPNQTSDDILKAVHGQIARMHVSTSLFDPASSARRTIWWYNMLATRPPIAVLEGSSERGCLNSVAKHASFEPQISIASRSLLNMGIRVVIDATLDDAPESTLDMLRDRERVMITVLDDIPFDRIRSDPEFITMMTKIARTDGLGAAVEQIVGGNPMILQQLSAHITLLSPQNTPIVAISDEDVAHRTVNFLLSQLNQICDDTESLHDLLGLIAHFKTVDAVPKKSLSPQQLARFMSSPNKVFRILPRLPDNMKVIVPASRAAVFALRHDLVTTGRTPSSWEELKAMVASGTQASESKCSNASL